MSTVLGSCVKLWACYPPTATNLALIYKSGDAEHKFITLSPFLEGGVYVVTTKQDTLHLPCGWLHAVYTLSGGILVGINWVSEMDIMTSEQYFVRESANKNCSANDIMAFVYALELGSQSADPKRQQCALEVWCRQRDTLKHLAKKRNNRGLEANARDLEKSMVHLGSMICTICRQSAHAHGKRLR